ncbi:phospholipase D family protein [Pararhodobacter sp.]|uniref:phospholipase D-like domain-containing protein n=1 Tax=Pararhodobacter sp. TaxID=2127056 RepID=UPI002AFFC4DF|nr:phospholipase D family protein [Pararhodobacter sp.]
MMAWLLWGLLGLIVVPVILGAVIWSTGRYVWRKEGTPSYIIPPGQGTALDDLLAPIEAQHPGKTGVTLVDDPAEALGLRLAMAQLAGRSLDLLYYIWHDDLSGRLLAKAVLEAADRGVRVRMLLDDVNALNRDPVYRALDRHPRIDVRLFNPIRNRDRGFRRGLEILLSILPYNRRMHGKLWITDGRLALTGGRNIGDEYFGLLEGPGHDFDDLDTLLSGRIVRDAEAHFDDFWNSGLALPIGTLWPGKRKRLRRFRTRLVRFLNKPLSRKRLSGAVRHTAEDAAAALRLPDLHWVSQITFLGDPPEKTLAKERDGWLPAALLPLLQNAQHSVRIMTPYLVPGRQGAAQLLALTGAGVRVEIITNGLAQSDNVLVHGAYRWYRTRLLTGGIKIFEVASRTAPRHMLHSKAFLVDDKAGFVGSFNFDMRSAFINTELGVMFDDPHLVAELGALFDTSITPENAYRVAMQGRLPAWSRGDGPVTHLEPDTNMAKRVISFTVGHLPIHRFL